MNRRELLKGLGALGLGTLLPASNVASGAVASEDLTEEQLKSGAGCWLTPSLTEGPYYFNPNLVRQDITEGRPGMAFHLNIKVINQQCQPIPNVMVDIWHCDKDGVYSGYGPTVGQTFMRGIQFTNAEGIAVFNSIYPGWYPGRATHVHFKVRTSAMTYVTSQYCFPDSVNNTVYATPLYSGRGPNPTTNAMDNIFANANLQYLTMDAQPNGTGGYDGNYIIGINAVTGVEESNFSPNEFYLEQNYPNPFNPVTSISYNLPHDAFVSLKVFDVLGNEMAEPVKGRKRSGKHSLEFDASDLGSGFYFYRLTAGDHVAVKEMLLLK